MQDRRGIPSEGWLKGRRAPIFALCTAHLLLQRCLTLRYVSCSGWAPWGRMLVMESKLLEDLRSRSLSEGKNRSSPAPAVRDLRSRGCLGRSSLRQEDNTGLLDGGPRVPPTHTVPPQAQGSQCAP